ncbi:uncharacterized protein LOC123379085 [Felis catus]|uniref:uncharacterized protein LOC123379085 n=1 Tax=Felis catus TaxID=9685 RepID=UPI001D19AD71|nr:uncharacterized protein LOC123379085 [Felis catus]
MAKGAGSPIPGKKPSVVNKNAASLETSWVHDGRGTTNQPGLRSFVLYEREILFDISPTEKEKGHVGNTVFKHGVITDRTHSGFCSSAEGSVFIQPCHWGLPVSCFHFLPRCEAAGLKDPHSFFFVTLGAGAEAVWIPKALEGCSVLKNSLKIPGRAQSLQHQELGIQALQAKWRRAVVMTSLASWPLTLCSSKTSLKHWPSCGWTAAPPRLSPVCEARTTAEKSLEPQTGKACKASWSSGTRNKTRNQNKKQGGSTKQQLPGTLGKEGTGPRKQGMSI